MNALTQHKIDHIHKLQRLEKSILENFETFEPKYEHHFAPGTYTRVMHIPADAVATGKIHREACTNILLKGKVVAITDEGRKTLTAPHIFKSEAGVKKAVYAIEDSIFVNIHPWDGPEDLELIEREVIIPEQELLEATECLGD